ncbi:MAG TPA: biotin carboxylase N-terminal domain-containing protein, partial [Myxococcota bacterium]|nr:biotin carboxylase N-terminal domain-containing protein [Myxococcota bacterium]
MPGIRKLLVANRAEVAIRVARAAAELGIETLAVAPEDDAACLHTRRADAFVPLEGRGAAAYLDAEQLVAVARREGCDAVHAGWGFLAENADFAEACERAGLSFVGPTPAQLRALGDKLSARRRAAALAIPILPGTSEPTRPEQAKAMLDALGPGARLMVKAVAGGGGRGMRILEAGADAEATFARCAAEASAAFGSPDLYVERLVESARHLEVQIVGDGSGAVVDLGERECTLQRQHQKLVEQAPSWGLDAQVRASIVDAARRLAADLAWRSLATFEFLLDRDSGEACFIEANPRLQVEHTVTEAVTGVDLVQAQLRIAGGEGLDALGLARRRAPRGVAIELRINTETIGDAGEARPAGGTIHRFVPPTGPGVRVDTHACAGFATSPSFDSLLAKIVVHASGDHAAAVAKARRALDELEIDGVETNAPFLAALLREEAVVANDVDTRYVARHAARLNAAIARRTATPESARAGARVDASDPLAVLRHGGAPAAGSAARDEPAPPGALRAPLQGTVVSLAVAPGDAVAAGAPVLVMEAMKMEHVITAAVSGTVRELRVAVGDAVYEGATLAAIDPGEVAAAARTAARELDLDEIRPDLREAIEAHAYGLDENRPAATAKRHAKGHRTARENVADLVDPDSLREYGALAIAAQRRRRDVQDLREATPGDGMVAGIASINGELFDGHAARAVVLAYDYSVLAGTQGLYNHLKKDRMLEIAKQQRLPVVLFGEGG